MGVFNRSVFYKSFFGSNDEEESENIRPTSPTDLMVVVDNNLEIDFTWNESDAGESNQEVSYQYILERDVASEWHSLSTGDLTDLPVNNGIVTYHYSDVLAIDTYRFQVRAYDGLDYSDWAVVTFDIVNIIPGSPQNLAVSIESPGSNPVFSWTKSFDPNIEQQIVYQYMLLKLNKDNGLYDINVKSGTWQTSDLISNGFVLSKEVDVEVGENMKFQIRSYDGVAYSSWSSVDFYLRMGGSIDKIIVSAPVESVQFEKLFFDKQTSDIFSKAQFSKTDSNIPVKI